MTLPINGFRLIALVPMFSGNQIRSYYGIADRGANPAHIDYHMSHDRYVVFHTNDPTAHEWNYSVSFHDEPGDAVKALYHVADGMPA